MRFARTVGVILCVFGTQMWAADVSAADAGTTSGGDAPTCDGGIGAGNDCQGESCCTRLPLPSGRFDIGQGEVAVEAFALDKFEATVGRFRTWIQAGRPLPDHGAPIGHTRAGKPVVWSTAFVPEVQSAATLAGWAKYDTWRAEMALAPKNSVNFYTAIAFCHFDGGRLPTEDEWIYAALGGDENRPHPWGSAAPTLEHAVYNCGGDGDPACDLADLLAVGSKPKGAGRWGHMDLAGSVFEWTQSGTMEHLFVREARSRGGGFCYIGGDDHRASLGLSAVTARYDTPDTVSHTVGVRCAYDAVP